MFRQADLRFPLLALLISLLTVVGCRQSIRSDEDATVGSRSPSARMEIVDALRQDQLAERHPSDGGGSVRFETTPEAVVAGGAGRWGFVYRAGPQGIAEDGWLFFQAPPFWGWSTPQVVAPDHAGFTDVRTAAAGLSLEPSTIDQQLLAIRIRGRALEEGEEISIVYGAGAAGAVADRYAESRSCFFFAVDGDGDGIRSLVESSICSEIEAGPPARLAVTLQSTARPGQVAMLNVAILDAVGNRVSGWTGSVSLEAEPVVSLPERLNFESAHEGARRIAIETREPGTAIVKARSSDGLAGESNPLKIETGIGRVLWADLHGHTELTDGSGTPKDYFRYARDVAGLDIVALTDHDHWGMRPLTVHPELWEEIRRETELFHRQDDFVTLLGYEWTSWIHGHRHVLYFSDQGRILSSVDEDYESPLQLWDALRDANALTFAHHSAGGPIATNWAVPPDPELEPVTEIVSVHGSSEAPDSPAVIYSPVAGNFVRDVLDRGYVFGFLGSGDGHDGHPGLAHINAASGGLAAVLSEDLSRSGIKKAMQDRRVYATNGPRILLEVDLAGHQMGSVIESRVWDGLSPQERSLGIVVSGTDSLQRLDLIRSGEVAVEFDCGGSAVCEADLPVLDVEPGEYLYVRAVQKDGGAAWSSPFYFR